MTPDRALWLSRVVTITGVVPLALIFGYSHRPGDFAGYLIVGELGLLGRDIYHNVALNTWPPFFGMMCIPLALLGRMSGFGTTVLWLLLSWTALLLCVDAVTRLVHGRGVRMLGAPLGTGESIPFGSKAILLPLLLCSYWIINNFEWLQVNIILFALTLYGLLLHREGAHARAGLLIGAAAALKVMPILFVPYFAWRRQWRAAAFTAAFTVALSIMPSLVYGWSGFTDQFATWLHVLDGGWGAGKRNLSVFAMFDRIIGHGYVPFMHAGSNDIPASSSPAVTLAVLAVVAIGAIAGLMTFRGPYMPHKRRVVAEWSIVFLVASVFGTVAWKHYLVVLLLPMALFVATWMDPQVDRVFARKLKIAVAVSFIMALSTASDLTGGALATRLEMSSVLTVMALLLLGTLFWYRARIDDATISNGNQ